MNVESLIIFSEIRFVPFRNRVVILLECLKEGTVGVIKHETVKDINV